MTKPVNPFNDDNYTGNDEQIADLKDALSEALTMIRSLREAYGNLHDGLSDMVGDGEGEQRLTETMIPDDYKWLIDTLEQCAGVDHSAKELLNQFPENDDDGGMAILPDGSTSEWDERLRMVDAVQVEAPAKPTRKLVPFTAKYWTATYGDGGLEVEFYEDKELYEQAVENIESNHDAGDLDSYTDGDVPTEVWSR